jgi:uncharacterized protein
VLEYTWRSPGEIESIVRFELEPHGDGTRLVLDHRQLGRAAGAGYGAGWHAHLEGLTAFLAGDAADAWENRYRAARPAYDEQAAAFGGGWMGFDGTALHEAVAAGDDDGARQLAQRQPDLRARPDGEGLLAAMRALYRGRPDLAAELLPPDGDLDVLHAAAFARTGRVSELVGIEPSLAATYSVDGFTPLHLACFGGSVETIRALIDAGAPLEAVSRNPMAQVRPLGTAAFRGDVAVARALLEAGADPNGPGEHGSRPLHEVAFTGDAAFVTVLLEYGADPSLDRPDGKTPVEVAWERGHDELAELLQGARA